MTEKEDALILVQGLIAKFKANEVEYLKQPYNETQARTDFITPLLAALGWDVDNKRLLSGSLREVVEEANVAIGDDAPNRRPDYELRLARLRKMFVEAKKPAVDLEKDFKAAFQARRYGYSAGMPIVVLTNFRQLAVYDCKTPPSETDGPHVSRINLYTYDEYGSTFDELWEYLSHDVVYSGRFDERYARDLEHHGTAPFDELFLSQVRCWRETLAVEIYANSSTLAAKELTYAVQLFLSRLIFLRICEDREIEKYEQLRQIVSGGNANHFAQLLERADKFYDSGLFDLVDDSRLGMVVSESVLLSIVNELYYPQSPYTFSVVEPEVLGRIYEQFLGEEIVVLAGAVKVVERPEVRESGGVVPTPWDIVCEIIDRTVLPLLDGKAVADIADMTILDMSCGSGVFLLSAYDRLCDFYLEWYIKDGVDRHRGLKVVELAGGNWTLSYEERRDILLRHIRGVDIDADAVEVAQLSLLLKLIEGQTKANLKAFVDTTGSQALPDLGGILKSGNSLVSWSEWCEWCDLDGRISRSPTSSVRPFDWEAEFPHEHAQGGFDLIVGNPPYIRIQNMAKYSPEEVNYYQSAESPYETAHQGNFDKYSLFIERGLALLKPTGRLGFIVPHKFVTTAAGRSVRALLMDRISEIVHFGAEQVFYGTSNYTSIVIIGPPTDSPLIVEPVESITAWRRGEHLAQVEVDRGRVTDERWLLGGTEFGQLLDGLRESGARELKDCADIFVGVQTSADAIYIVEAIEEDEDAILANSLGSDWILEKTLLKRCLLDVEIEAFQQPAPNRWMIFPYDEVDGKPALIPPDVMAEAYPGCWDYLNAHRELLEKRSISGGKTAERQWYQYGRSQSLNKMEGDKIVLPILSLESKCAPDRLNTYVTGGGNGPYYLVRPNGEGLPLEALLAVLNHPLTEATVRTHTSVFRGGYYSHGKQFIEDILVPDLDEGAVADIVSKVQDIEAALKDRSAARIPDAIRTAERRYKALRSGLETTINGIFGLSSADLLTIQSVPMP